MLNLVSMVTPDVNHNSKVKKFPRKVPDDSEDTDHSQELLQFKTSGKKIILCVESRAPCDLNKRYHQQFVVSLVCFNSNQSPLVPRRTIKLGVIDKSLAYKHPASL